jgi:hypothetical protein
MRDNTQNGGASSILHGSAKTTLKALETRQLSLALPCTKSGQVGEVERETGKIKAKGHPSAQAKQKELKLNATLPHRQNEKLKLNATLPLPQKEKFIPHEGTLYLQIQSVQIPERVDPERNSYVLVVQPVGVRACGGQFTADEAYEIARLTKGWDWRLDPDDKPRCLGRLEALLERICKRSSLGNEASEAGQLGINLTKPLSSDEVNLVKKFENEGGEV